mgnify:CR=1 FL=1
MSDQQQDHPLPRPLQPGQGYRLPPRAYTDPAWLERERRSLFPSVWNFVGSVHELAAPGSYVTADVGPYPIVIVRGEDGQLRAFHNICRHRGARLLDGQGNCERIVCPYHRWQYALDGTLSNIPQHKTQFADTRTQDWPLQPVELDVWMGLVFVNPDGSAPPLQQWLGDLPERLGAFDLESLSELARCDYHFDANWKFYVENHIDWYHLWYTHPRTLSMLDCHAGYWHQTGPHWLSFAPYKADAGYQEPFTALPGLNEEQRMVNAHLLFPHLPMFGGGSWFGVGLLTPLSPSQTRMSLRIWGLPGQDTEEFMASFHEITQQEDAWMAARLQQAASSPAFAIGPMAQRYEAPITDFHQHYLAAMGPA